MWSRVGVLHWDSWDGFVQVDVIHFCNSKYQPFIHLWGWYQHLPLASFLLTWKQKLLVDKRPDTGLTGNPSWPCHGVGPGTPGISTLSLGLGPDSALMPSQCFVCAPTGSLRVPHHLQHQIGDLLSVNRNLITVMETNRISISPNTRNPVVDGWGQCELSVRPAGTQSPPGRLPFPCADSSFCPWCLMDARWLPMGHCGQMTATLAGRQDRAEWLITGSWETKVVNFPARLQEKANEKGVGIVGCEPDRGICASYIQQIGDSCPPMAPGSCAGDAESFEERVAQTWSL